MKQICCDKNQIESIDMETDFKTYLVTVLDLADDSVFAQIVKAPDGYLAGAYAIQFNEDGEKREDGYKLISSFSLAAVQNFVKTMEDCTLTPITDVSTIDIEVAEGVFIAE